MPWNGRFWKSTRLRIFLKCLKKSRSLLRSSFHFPGTRILPSSKEQLLWPSWPIWESPCRVPRADKKGHLININKSHVSAHFSTLIQELSDSYKRISDQSIQLLRYAKDLSNSYNRMKEDDDLREKLSRYVARI